MKNIITLAKVSLLFFNGFSQNKNKEGVIKKNQKGIITSVKFSAAMEKNKIPASANAFFEAYLDYINRKQNYSSFLTVIRQLCRVNNISYTSKIIYNKSSYDIVYYIYY